MEKFLAVMVTLIMLMVNFLTGGWIHCADTASSYEFKVEFSSDGAEVPNLASNVNVWNMGTSFINPERNAVSDVFEFVEYVQLMQCSGGEKSRDLFSDPLDTETLDDYDFTRLIENCRGILSLGAKPHLKLGSVPLKYTSGATSSAAFSTNLNPPDDYVVYYNYIKALVTALKDEFGAEELLSWRWGVMTEYENSDWFIAKSGDPKETAEAYCMLYDYTVAALEDVLGDGVCVGAHSMTVAEGLWDEAVFIRHCASGTNYATGKKGTTLKYLSASFYDYSPGTYTSGKTLPETIEYLRKTAEKNGFTDLYYGIDEGRILVGLERGTDDIALNSRSVGYTWQGAYDARLYGQLLDSGADYFSFWFTLSEGLFKGNPTVSYHVSRLISQYAGSKLADVRETKAGLFSSAEVSLYSALDEESGTARAFVYNFDNDLAYDRDVGVRIRFSVPSLPDGEKEITLYEINDDCNWFDEWREDMARNNIDGSCFAWSPDDGNVSLMKDERAWQVYRANEERYAECAVLTPVTVTGTVEDGVMTVELNVKANTVDFIEFSVK